MINHPVVQNVQCQWLRTCLNITVGSESTPHPAIIIHHYGNNNVIPNVMQHKCRRPCLISSDLDQSVHQSDDDFWMSSLFGYMALNCKIYMLESEDWWYCTVVQKDLRTWWCFLSTCHHLIFWKAEKCCAVNGAWYVKSWKQNVNIFFLYHSTAFKIYGYTLRRQLFIFMFYFILKRSILKSKNLFH